MLRKSLAILSGVVLCSGLGAAFSTPSYADPSGPFSCDTNSLTTVVGAKRSAVMRWRSGQFSSAGYSPLRRCLEVSERFNQFYSTGQLNYVTAGLVNGMPVVCATSAGGSCDSTNVLFTLNRRNSGNVAGILQTLFDNRAGAAGAVVNESTERVYIDMNKLLANLGADTSAPTSQRPSANTDQPKTAPSGGGW